MTEIIKNRACRLIDGSLHLFVALGLAGGIVWWFRGWSPVTALVLLPAGGALAAELVGAFLWDEGVTTSPGGKTRHRRLADLVIMAVLGATYGVAAVYSASAFVQPQFVTITKVASEVTIEFLLEGVKPDGAYAYIKTENGLYPAPATSEGPIWTATLHIGPRNATRGSRSCDARYEVGLITVSDDQILLMEALIKKISDDDWKKGIDKRELPSGFREVRLPLALQRDPKTCVLAS